MLYILASEPKGQGSLIGLRTMKAVIAEPLPKLVASTDVDRPITIREQVYDCRRELTRFCIEGDGVAGQ
jgi:hypothetical protein